MSYPWEVIQFGQIIADTRFIVFNSNFPSDYGLPKMRERERERERERATVTIN